MKWIRPFMTEKSVKLKFANIGIEGEEGKEGFAK